LPEHCRVQPLIAVDAAPCQLPQRLRRTAIKLRARFQQLAPARIWLGEQQEGTEIDLDAYLRFCSERAAGQAVAADRLYRDLRNGARDLACLLLADLSLSTDSWISDYARVIDVIRDSLLLFAESLAATGDRFAMYGFSSRRRDPVRFHQLKGFTESYNDRVRGRINVIKPGYYTRMGTAIRHASRLLADQPAGRRLLLLLTDGKPNDLDKYEGRYGIEDTRHALRQARESGLQPFCVTVDRKAGEYLPHLFGSGGYVVIRKPSQLPRQLPLLYARLTG
jgi:nitric oxide reductase NorD protein